MEPFNLLSLTADHRAAREREAHVERLWRRGRRLETSPPSVAVTKQPCSGHIRHLPGHHAA